MANQQNTTHKPDGNPETESKPEITNQKETTNQSDNNPELVSQANQK